MKMLQNEIAKLEALDVPCTARPDFKKFWKNTLGKIAKKSMRIASKKVLHPIKNIEARDISFEGIDGTRIATWLLLPSGARRGKTPLLVSFHGRGGSRGEPEQYAHLLMMGLGVLAMDCRMQGGITGWNGKIPNGDDNQLNPFVLGCLNRETAYYYHILTDALLCLRLARECGEFDLGRIIVAGSSQGGAIALSMAGLDQSVSLCSAQVPSNCWLEKRIMGKSGGGNELAQFIRRHPEHFEKVCETMSYVDNLNFAPSIQCETLACVGLCDPVCPPDTVYAAFNKIKAPKRMIAYPFAEHDGGGILFEREKLEFIASRFKI